MKTHERLKQARQERNRSREIEPSPLCAVSDGSGGLRAKEIQGGCAMKKRLTVLLCAMLLLLCACQAGPPGESVVPPVPDASGSGEQQTPGPSAGLPFQRVKSPGYAYAASSILYDSFSFDEDRNIIYPENYGGYYLQTGKDFDLHICIVDLPNQDVSDYEALLADYIDHVVFENVEYSYQELLDASCLIMEDLQSSGILVTSGGPGDIYNKVIIGVEESEIEKLNLQSANIEDEYEEYYISDQVDFEVPVLFCITGRLQTWPAFHSVDIPPQSYGYVACSLLDDLETQGQCPDNYGGHYLSEEEGVAHVCIVDLPNADLSFYGDLLKPCMGYVVFENVDRSWSELQVIAEEIAAELSTRSIGDVFGYVDVRGNGAAIGIGRDELGEWTEELNLQPVDGEEDQYYTDRLSCQAPVIFEVWVSMIIEPFR